MGYAVSTSGLLSIVVRRQDQTPLYQQIKREILRRIDSGELRPGQRLPSEQEFERQLAVSRITVRQAITALAIEGRLTRVPGRGTFVAEHVKVSRLTSLSGFGENMRALGLTPSYRTVDVREMQAGDLVASQLSLADGEHVLLIHRVLLANKEPIAIQYSYLPLHLIAAGRQAFTADLLDHSSLYTLLEQKLHIVLARALETVEPAMASALDQELLDVSPDALLLRVHRVTYSTADVPVEYVRLLYRMDRYAYRVELFRPGAGDRR